MLRTYTLIFSLLFTACGYHFQGATNPLRGVGIEKIYVKSFSNKTDRPGIEQLFTTAMIREIRRSRVFQLVNSPEQADAILEGEVSSASTSPGGTTQGKFAGTDPKTENPPQATVAVSYSSSVSCSVVLRDRDGFGVFSRDSSAGKSHPALAPKNTEGIFDAELVATAPLSNESEQRIAYQQLAIKMMADIYQRMIDVF